MSEKDIHVILKRLLDRYTMQFEFNIIGEEEFAHYLNCLEEIEDELEE